MEADVAITCVFSLLQLILAPILYPFGYLLEIFSIVLLCAMNRSVREVELRFLEPLVLILLLTNVTLSVDLPSSGYALRIVLVIFICYHSRRLQDLSNALLSPLVSILICVELLGFKQLYPWGYMSQLGLIFFVYLSDCLNFRKSFGASSLVEPASTPSKEPRVSSLLSTPATQVGDSLLSLNYLMCATG